MAKEIKVRVKDINKLEFELLEDARIGDYINLNSINNSIDLSEVKDILETKKNEYYKPFKEQEKKEIERAAVNNFLNSDAYRDEQTKMQNLSTDNVRLKEELNGSIAKYKQSDEFKKIQENTNNLQKQIVQLQTALNNEEKLAIDKFKNSSDYLNLLKANQDAKTKEALLIKEKEDAIIKFKETSEYQNLLLQLRTFEVNNTKLQGDLENSKITAIEDYKKTRDYQDLLDSDKKLQEAQANFDAQLKIANEKFRSSDEYQNLLKDKTQVTILNNELQNEKSKLTQLEENYKKQISDLNKNHQLALKNQLLIEKDNIIKTYKESEEFQGLLKDKENLEKENERILNIQHQKTVKDIGEDLEKWIFDKYNDTFGLAFHDSATFTKANNLIENTKPDFLFEIFNSNLEKNDPNYITGTVVIEAKNELDNTLNHKKNADHYKKLDSDRQKNKGQYAILVSTLEKDLQFSIFMPAGYSNMFVVRPQWLMPLLSLLHTIFLKEQKIQQSATQFKDKEEIKQMFEDFRSNILENSFKNIKTNLDSIEKAAQRILKDADIIIESRNTIVRKHMTTIQNKIENFRIEKVFKKISKLPQQLEQEDDASVSNSNSLEKISVITKH